MGGQEEGGEEGRSGVDKAWVDAASCIVTASGCERGKRGGECLTYAGLTWGRCWNQPAMLVIVTTEGVGPS